MISQQTLKGNLVLQDYTTAFTLNQGDKGVPFKVELLENGTPYTLLSDDIVTIEWLKPNGSPFLQDTGITKGDTYVEITTPEAISQSSGSGTFNIIISNNNVRKGTIRREYKVVPTSMKPGSISEDVITDAITELRNLNTELAETVQNNQEIINSNSAATKSDIASVNSSLEDIAKLPSNLALDGITDDRYAFQSFFDTITEGSRVLFPPDKKIKLTNVININKDNLVIDLNNCEILWAGVGTFQDNGARDNGIFNIKGEYGTEYTISEVRYFNSDYIPNRKYCRVKISTPTDFVKGEFVKLTYVTGTNTDNTFYPSCNIISQVMDVDATYIYLDYYAPFSLSGLTVTGTVTKVTPRKNIILKNFTIIDTTEGDEHTDASTNDANRDKWIVGVRPDVCVNSEFSNIKGLHMRMPLVMTSRCYNCRLENLETNYPKCIGAGEGYTLQVTSSYKCFIKNITGANERHILDFSASAYCNAEDMYSSYGNQVSITFHGICEHDITLKNVTGGIGLGSGIAYFPCINENITLENVNSYIKSWYCKNMIINNSIVILDDFYANQTIINNSNVTIRRNRRIKPHIRGNGLFNYFKCNDCTITTKYSGTNEKNSMFDNHDLVELKHCIYNGELVGSRLEVNKTNITNVKKFKIIDCEINDLYVNLLSTDNDIEIQVKGCDYNSKKESIDTPLFNINDSTNKIKIKVYDTDFANTSGANKILFRIPDNPTSPVDLYCSRNVVGDGYSTNCNILDNVTYHIDSNNDFSTVTHNGTYKFNS